MEVFGIIGMSMGMMGFIFALSAADGVKKLEKRLQDAGVLTQEQGGESPKEP